VTIIGMPSEPGTASGSPLPPGQGIAASIGEIDAAGDEATLRAGVERAQDVIAAELRAHTPAVTLAAAWSEVLRHGVAAAARLADGTDGAAWTWFVSGSVGRCEAAPGSDVETMIVLGDAVTDDDKDALMRRAADVHAVLERCGIHGDANGVMGSRSRFCRREASWAEGIARWCARPAEDRGVVMTGLMADSNAVRSGRPPRVAEDDWLNARVLAEFRSSYPVRQAMLQDATAMRAVFPSRLKVFATSVDTVDVKLAAIDPVVKLARWAGMSAGCHATSTLTRLDAAAAAGIVESGDVSSLRDCFQWLLRFRWRIRADWGERSDGGRAGGERSDGGPAGGGVSDVVTLSDMAPQERAVLRSVAREVAGISRKLTYLASTSSFH
jgi:CBS domain-containing protein